MGGRLQATIKKRTLAAACGRVSKAVGRAYPYIRLGFSRGMVTAMATTLDVSIMTRQGLAKDDLVGHGGTVCLSAAELLKLLDALPDVPLELSGLDNCGMKIECDDFQGVVPGVALDMFPEIDLDPGDDSPEIILPGHNLSELLAAVSHCANKKGYRASEGVHLRLSSGCLTTVATDGKRMSLASLRAEQSADVDLSVTLPYQSCAILGKLSGNVTLYPGETSLLACCGGSGYRFTIYAEEYPDYERVIPRDHPGCLVVDAGELISAAKRVNILSDDDGVTLDILPHGDGGDILVKAIGTQGAVSDLVSSEVTGEPAAVKINPAYLLAGLAAASRRSSDVVVKYGDPLAPIVILPADHSGWDRRLEIIMPMRHE